MIRAIASKRTTLSAARHFEELVLQLLDQQASLEGRTPIQTQWTGPEAFRFDGFLPDGLGAFEGPLVVEVKYFSRLTDVALRELSATIQRSALETIRLGASAVLIVHNLLLDDAAQEHVQRVLQNLAEPQVYVWGLDSLNDLAALQEKPQPVASEVASMLEFELRGPDAWIARRDGHLEELKAEIARNGVSIFLGAGVSQGSGIPTWSELINRLFASAFRGNLGTDVNDDELKLLSEATANLNPSPLQLTRYLRRAMSSDGKDFTSGVVEILYSDTSQYAVSPLLNEVVELCKPTRAGNLVRSVVTYNFDDLFEVALTERNLKHLPIYHGNMRPSSLELPIYHVHGFLPRVDADHEHIKENLLVFSEENYHRLYIDPYHWTNIRQIGTLRDHTCILLGLSLTDPNLRRLLEASVGDAATPRHYAFMKRLSRESLVDAEPRLLELDDQLIGTFLRAHHVTQTDVASEIGVNIVWFDDHSEMPPAVRDLAS